jgi:hypothetical protein
MDPVLKALKQELSDAARPVLAERDGAACAACASRGELQVAHITSARAFCYSMVWTQDTIRASYRMDNLVLLCKPCHGAQTMGANRIAWTAWQLRTASPDSFEYRCALNRIGKHGIESCDEADRRRRAVASVFGKIQRRRGWLSAIDLVRGQTWDGKPLPAQVLLGPMVGPTSDRPLTAWM